MSEQSPNPSFDPSKIARLIPWIVFLVALLIRLPGIGWGLKNDLRNQSLHPDETDIFLYSQRIEPAHLKFTPGFYSYGTLYLTELKVASDFVTTYTGAPKDKDEDSYWAWVARCELAGRILTAIAGAATATLAYLTALRAFGFMAGGFAGIVVATAPGHIIHSRFQTVDITAAMLACLALYFALRLLPKPDEDELAPRNATILTALSGAAAGLSGGTKYTGVLAILSTVAALWLTDRKKLIPIALLSAVAAFLISTPGAIFEQKAFIDQFLFEMNHSSSGHGLVFEGTSNGFLFHLGNLSIGIGLLTILVALGGIAYGLRNKEPLFIVLLAFVIPYYIVIGRGEVKFYRYTLPLVAPLAIGAGYALSEASKRKGWGHAVVAAGILGVGGVPFGGIRSAALATVQMNSEDPRDEAARYLRKQGDVHVGLPRDPWFWSPSLYPNVGSIRRIPWSTRLEEMLRLSNPKAIHVLNIQGQPTVFDTRLIREEKPEYIVYSSFEYGPAERLFGKSDTQEVKDVKLFSERLAEHYEAEIQFGHPMFMIEDLEYIQPAVYVWKRK